MNSSIAVLFFFIQVLIKLPLNRSIQQPTVASLTKNNWCRETCFARTQVLLALLPWRAALHQAWGRNGGQVFGSLESYLTKTAPRSLRHQHRPASTSLCSCVSFWRLLFVCFGFFLPLTDPPTQHIFPCRSYQGKRWRERVRQGNFFRVLSNVTDIFNVLHSSLHTPPPRFQPSLWPGLEPDTCPPACPPVVFQVLGLCGPDPSCPNLSAHAQPAEDLQLCPQHTRRREGGATHLLSRGISDEKRGRAQLKDNRVWPPMREQTQADKRPVMWWSHPAVTRYKGRQ